MMYRMSVWYSSDKRSRLGYGNDRSHVEPPGLSVTGVQWTGLELKWRRLSTGYFKVFYKHARLGSPILH